MTPTDVLGHALIMFIASLIAALLPSILCSSSSSSPSSTRLRTRLFHTVGVGLLISTAFVSILPTGIERMYQPPRVRLSSRSDIIQPTDVGHRLTPLALPSFDLAFASSPADDWRLPLAQFKQTAGTTSAAKTTHTTVTPSSADHSHPVAGASPSAHHVHHHEAASAHDHGHSEADEKESTSHVHPSGTEQMESEVEENEEEHDHASIAPGGADQPSHTDAPSSHRRHLLNAAIPPVVHAHSHSHSHIVSDVSPHATHPHSHQSHTVHTAAHSSTPHAAATTKTTAIRHEKHILTDEQPDSHSHQHSDSDSSSSTTPSLITCFSSSHGSKHMGFSLALGFVLMLLLDRWLGKSAGPPSRSQSTSSSSASSVVHSGQLSCKSSTHSEGIELKSRNATSSTSAPDFKPLLSNTNNNSSTRMTGAHQLTATTTNGSGNGSGGTGEHINNRGHARVNSNGNSNNNNNNANTPNKSHSRSVLLGVLVHACVEGFSFGASSIGSSVYDFRSSSLSLLLHHAPTAFGVSCFLAYQGRSTADVRQLSLLYASAAPLSSLFTVLTLGNTDLLGSGDGSLLGLMYLFSGGAFLFTIAVHILPEMQAQHTANKQTINNGATNNNSNSNNTATNSPNDSPSLDLTPTDATLISIPPLLNRTNSPTHAHDDDSKTIAWKSVSALIIGLLLPLMCQIIQPRTNINN